MKLPTFRFPIRAYASLTFVACWLSGCAHAEDGTRARGVADLACPDVEVVDEYPYDRYTVRGCGRQAEYVCETVRTALGVRPYCVLQRN
jgi:hypothetical protein